MSRRTWLLVGLTCGAVAVGTLGGALLSESSADAAAEWGKALLTLFVAILVSGLLTLMLSEYSRGQQQREANREQAFNWLRSLVEANNRLNAASVLLSTREGSATTTYGAQVRNFIKARITLRSLQEDLASSAPDVAEHLEEMLEYLKKLGEEYTMNYPRLAWAQRVHEEFLRRQLSNPDLPKELIEDPADPWRVLQEGHFPTLVDLLKHGEDYMKNYRNHYKHAKDTLKQQLTEFGGKPVKARDLAWQAVVSEHNQPIPGDDD
jgi:uncharacterized membrane-anchored protein YhcB (DUF1043 family)